MEKEEAINILNGYMGGEIDPESTELYHAIELAVDILESQSSLPSNLDEAAEDYANTHYGEFFEVEYEFGDPIETIVDDKPFVRDAFKSGAEWMVGQGCTTEKTVDRTPFNGPAGICLNLHDSTGFKIGDKVIVQVRKKQ